MIELSKTLEEFLSNPESIKENDTEILTADDIIKHESEEWVILKKSNNGSVIIKE